MSRPVHNKIEPKQRLVRNIVYAIHEYLKQNDKSKYDAKQQCYNVSH